MANTRSSEPRTTKERAQGNRAPNALALLKADHRAVEDLFEEYEHARRNDRKHSLVQQICHELTAHAQMEEQAFYPEAQQALGAEHNLVDEARVEHASLKWLIAQLESEAPDSELYPAKVKVLKEYVLHHVREEEKEIFPKLRKTELDLDALGQTLLETKQQLKKGMSEPMH